MPRYGTRSLLIAFALVAVWLATFGSSATSWVTMMAAQDLRRSMLLLLLVAVACLAVSSRGQRRAFWSAFAIVMFLCGGINLQRPLHRYLPDFAWQQMVGAAPTPYYPPVAAPPAPAVTSSAIVRGQIVYSAPMPNTYGLVTMSGSPGWSAFSETAAAAWTLALAALSGFIAAYIYSRTRPAAATDGAASPTPRQIVEQELQR
jgi:hypothetical protein